MGEISRKELMIKDIEYFIFCENEKLRKTKDFTFEFEVFDQCKEIETRYCVFFENMDEAIDVISSFNQEDYKTLLDEDVIKHKLMGFILKNDKLNSQSNLWISFYV